MTWLAALLIFTFGAMAGLGIAAYNTALSAKPRFREGWPLCQVSFDPDATDQDLLKFLAEASHAVRTGRLRQAKKLADNTTSDQEE